ncbi:hypothetical protein [Pontibacterium sp.]|uniref:hypothetical protein n=1 Tax=Pontibacterium sp. TaxID=2036026 RepID=UPI003561CB89
MKCSSFIANINLVGLLIIGTISPAYAEPDETGFSPTVKAMQFDHIYSESGASYPLYAIPSPGSTNEPYVEKAIEPKKKSVNKKSNLRRFYIGLLTVMSPK